MKLKLFPYDYTLISKYRDVLMGIGILGVMLSHYFQWTGMDGRHIALVFKPFIGLVYTEGFLLLSGFGLFYSFTRNADKRGFWLKRINRLIIPFVLMYLPFGVYKMAIGGGNLFDFFLEISTLFFWLKGNNGLWYISVTALLYFLFPFIYDYVFRGNLKSKIFSLLVIFYAIGICIHQFAPAYYEMTYHGYMQMPCFVWGMVFGYLAFNRIRMKKEWLLFLLLLTAAVILNMLDGVLEQYGNGILRITCILLLCPLLSWLSKIEVSKYIELFFTHFGKISLELYVLHMLFHRVFGSLNYGAELSVIIPIIVAPFVHKLTSREWIPVVRNK